MREEEDEGSQLNQAKDNLELVRENGLVVLGKERFHQAGPDQEESCSGDKRGQGTGNGPKTPS